MNQYVLTNTAFTRVIPLAIWLCELTDHEKIKQIVVSEVEITHPNKTVQELAFVYVMAFIYLLNNSNQPDRAQKAFELALKLAKGPLAATID